MSDEWKDVASAPRRGWMLVTNWAMAKNGYVEVAKRDLRRKDTRFIRRNGGMVYVQMWAPIPPLPEVPAPLPSPQEPQ